MKERVWISGPPQHIGWWNASIVRDDDGWRWWDGEYWSWVVFKGESPRIAAERATIKATNQKLIEWTHYYPENACVPRIAP